MFVMKKVFRPNYIHIWIQYYESSAYINVGGMFVTHKCLWIL